MTMQMTLRSFCDALPDPDQRVVVFVPSSRHGVPTVISSVYDVGPSGVWGVEDLSLAELQSARALWMPTPVI